MAGKKRDYLSESEFWDSLSLNEAMAGAQPVDIEVAIPKKAISLRMDEDIILETKQIAKKLRIGYQTLFRIWIREGLRRQQERMSSKARKGRAA